jgi:diguanylate cyclase (GGDEF)-like protein/PAS domain S-box-containing protein
MSSEEGFYKDLVDHLYDGVYFVNRDRVVTYWNQGAERITGYSAGRALGRSCRDNLLNHVTANGVQLCLTQCPLAACMEDGKVREAEVFLHHADGHRVPVLVRASPLRDSTGAIVGAVETFSNNTGLITARQQLRELARRTQMDGLTGVANRVHLDSQLRAIVAACDPAMPAAGLLFIDIDHFKSVNDRHGHAVGDRALRMVAATLQHSLRATDLVGRWGGEEFVVILHEVATRDKLRAIADKLRHLVASSSLDLDTQHLSLSISIGATLLRPDDTPDTFVARADAMMYQSKRGGGDQVCVDNA